MSQREDIRIPSDGEQLAAYVYRPAAADRDMPCVVMAHGFSGTRDDGLPAYAEAFRAAGYAVSFSTSATSVHQAASPVSCLTLSARSLITGRSCGGHVSSTESTRIGLCCGARRSAVVMCWKWRRPIRASRR